MVTIKQALTNTHGASIRRTIKDIEVGEAFKWKDRRGGAESGWCVRVTNDAVKPEFGLPYAWMPLESKRAGIIYGDAGQAEIHQP